VRQEKSASEGRLYLRSHKSFGSLDLFFIHLLTVGIYVHIKPQAGCCFFDSSHQLIFKQLAGLISSAAYFKCGRTQLE
jgi:hypothetical protein